MTYASSRYIFYTVKSRNTRCWKKDRKRMQHFTQERRSFGKRFLQAVSEIMEFPRVQAEAASIRNKKHTGKTVVPFR